MTLQTIRLSAIEGIGGDEPAGRRLGPYVVLEKLGSGASANVYRARHHLIGLERALKVPRPPACGWPEQRDRFLREARVAARLRHPNVVSVYDCGGATDGAPYIVMEYVAGRSLASRLRDGVPAPAETLRIAAQLAAALDHAHALGIVHRDVKPANVLLGSDGVVRLGDFGIAHLELEPGEPSGAAAPGDSWAGLGTPAYMAPEQRLAQRDGLGPHTDVYGLAVVLYEMMTGRTPYGDRGVEPDGDLRAGPPSPRAVNPYLPPAVDRIVALGLSRDARLRPSSAGVLVAELRAALDGASVEPRPTPRSAGAPEAAGGDDTPTVGPPLERRPATGPPASRRRGRMAALLARRSSQ